MEINLSFAILLATLDGLFTGIGSILLPFSYKGSNDSYLVTLAFLQ